MPLSPGQVLNNRFQIEALLGQGGFGFVYRAWDRNLNIAVAIKELSTVTSPQADLQFSFEARRLANLRHPALPYVVDHFSIAGQGQYLVSEFVEGEDLAGLLGKSSTGLPVAQVLGWMEAVLEAVNYLHSQNPPIIHRDIKPANIKLALQGRVMLVDYGIARAADPSRQPTAIMGSVQQAFIPPEQYDGVTDVRSDIYAIGATLYALLTGRPPIASLRRQVGTALPPPRQINPAILPGLETVILRAMELEAGQRYQSIQELRAALAYAGTSTVRAPPAPPLQGQAAGYSPSNNVPATGEAFPGAGVYAPLPPQSKPRQANRTLIWIGLAIVGLCLLASLVTGLGAFWYFSPEATTVVSVVTQSDLSLTQTAVSVQLTTTHAATSVSATDTPGIPSPPPPTATAQPTPTFSLTPAPSATPPDPSPTAPTKPTWVACPGAPPSRLYVGDKAYVGFTPPLPNRVRIQPNTQSEILGLLQPGEQMEILEGPVCSNQWVWWRVRSLSTNLLGWTAEGDAQSYWLNPLP